MNPSSSFILYTLLAVEAVSDEAAIDLSVEAAADVASDNPAV